LLNGDYPVIGAKKLTLTRISDFVTLD